MFFLKKKKKDSIEIKSFVDGSVIDLSLVPDEVFSTKAMGDGFAICASNTLVKSPVNGKVVLVYPTNHAIGIELENGVTILLHIGLDSATTKPEYFDLKVSQGQNVKVGDDLVEMVPEMLNEPLYIMCVLMENSSNASYEFSNLNKDLNAGSTVITFK